MTDHTPAVQALTNTMSRFLRSKKLRSVLYETADGKCQLCGETLADEWHADHIVPHSVSGRTNVHEMQALCPACNWKKGSRMPLRTNQRESIQAASVMASRGKPSTCLVWSVPGSGKSWIPPLMINEFPDRVKLAWFVPRISLRDQATQGALDDFGMNLRGSGNDIDPCRGNRGFVATHAALQSNPRLWEHELRRSEYVLVIDEAHHAKINKDGELSPLARAINRLPYVARVLMTGTLETNDSKFIYGVDYKDGLRGLVPDPDSADQLVRYDRETALREDALIPVEFHHHDGPVKWKHLESGMEDGSVLSMATRDQEANAVFTALTTNIAKGLLVGCLAHHSTHGQKLLVVVHSQKTAAQYHRELSMRMPTFLAISDNDNARDDIKLFKETPKSCLVTCQMAYEGLDDKDITHIACLTNIRSTPWIEQMIARAWRYKKGKGECYCFVPDDPRMNRVIKRIYDEQPKEIVDLDTDRAGVGPERTDIMPLHGKVNGVRIAGLDGESRHSPRQQEFLDHCVKFGFTQNDERLLSLIEDIQDEQVEPRMTVDEEESYLRRAIADTCKQADRTWSDRDPPAFGMHQKKLIRITDKSITQMTIPELRNTYGIAKTFLS